MHTLPSWEISIKTKRDYRETLINRLYDKAIKLGIGRYQELVIRDIVLSDLGLSTWEIPSGIGKVNWIYHKIRAEILISIYKIVQLSDSPTIDSIRFGEGVSGNILMGTNSLSLLYGIAPFINKLRFLKNDATSGEELLDPKGLQMEGWFSEPYVYSQGNIINIEISSSKTGCNELVLVGFVIEKIGSIVT